MNGTSVWPTACVDGKACCVFLKGSVSGVRVGEELKESCAAIGQTKANSMEKLRRDVMATTGPRGASLNKVLISSSLKGLCSNGSYQSILLRPVKTQKKWMFT